MKKNDLIDTIPNKYLSQLPETEQEQLLDELDAIFNHIPKALRSHLPEIAWDRFFNDEQINVKSIMVHYGDDRESFMRECISANSPADSRGNYFDIKLKTDTPGYVLTSLLNIDFNAVEKVFADYNTDEWFSYFSGTNLPVNCEDIYSRLLSISDVFRLYLPDEWSSYVFDLQTIVMVGETIENLRKYISFCERQQLPYNSPFFSFLISLNFFGPLGDDIFVQAEQVEIFDDMFEYGQLIGELDKVYEVFTKSLNQNAVGVNCYLLEPDDRLQKIAMISFKELSDRGKVIRKCQNCGKYFIPTKRSDTLYCDNPSPADPELTCKEYGTRRLWYEKQKEDELATLSRKIASAKGMLAKRNPDIPGYAAAYNYFKEQRLVWKKAVKDGTKSRDEYREWLLAMQNQKTL